MGWEKRKRGGPYYTRYRRDGKRMVREYFSGEAAQRAAEEDEQRRRKKGQYRYEERIERDRLRKIDAQMEDYCRQVSAVLEASLAAAGYRRHSRGEWRKVRQSAGARKDDVKVVEENELTAPPASPE